MNDENKNVSEDQLAEVSGGLVFTPARRDLAERGRSYRKTKRRRRCVVVKAYARGTGEVVGVPWLESPREGSLTSSQSPVAAVPLNDD